MMTRTTFAILTACVALLALTVVIVGAYVRLSDAGLGCPDWPGCYGRAAAPATAEAMAQANADYPHRPVEPAKARKEMLHRYLAGALGLAIVLLATLAWRYHRRSGLPVGLPTLLVALVIFQGLLGMWTVTLLVKPAIVTAHLAGGMATLAVLWWLVLRLGGLCSAPLSPPLKRLRPWAWGGLILLCAQILLGGWTSTNYAAVACTEFPTCYGDLWWPPTNFAEGFTIWPTLGVSYEYGVLGVAARTAIHLTHRLGALIVFLYLGTLAVQVLRRARHPRHFRVGLVLLGALLLQVGLGIANVLGHLALPIAVAHNGGAALLLLAVVTMTHTLTQPKASWSLVTEPAARSPMRSPS
jgi:cytochrome c oxidase assembly protein subunit 15